MVSQHKLNERSAQFMEKVFLWMGIGLLLTSVSSFAVLTSETLANLIFGNQLVFWILIIVQVGLVLAISWMMKKMSSQVATILFMLYSVTMGLTLSVIFIMYTAGSIFLAFVSAAGMFFAMALYGYFTKKDLTGFGSLLLMALIGLIIASVINAFMKSSMFDYIISFVGVFIFTGLTAYSTQRAKKAGEELKEGSEDFKRSAIFYALTLYLDFINLFLMLLRIFGRERD